MLVHFVWVWYCTNKVATDKKTIMIMSLIDRVTSHSERNCCNSLTHFTHLHIGADLTNSTKITNKKTKNAF